MGNYVPGDVEIGDVTLEGRDFSQNFNWMMFKEHLLSPVVRAKIGINQYTGEMLNFDGTKPSSLVFNTPSGDKRRYSNLLSNGLNDLTTDDAQRSRNFTVELISKHGLLNNATQNYQKSFKNKQISSVVEGILKEGLGLDIPVNIDSTKGLHGSDDQPIILTQKSPLRHLDDLRRFAISQKDYDGFLTFSGIGDSGGEEFFFKSIFDMIKGEPVAEIMNRTNFEINSTLNAPTMLNAIEIFPSMVGTTLSKGASFARGTSRYDVNRGVFDVPKLETGVGRQQHGSDTSLNPGQLSGFVNDPYNGMPGTGNVILEDSRRPDSHRAETAPYTDSLFQDMMQHFVTVKVPGNSNFKVGQVVNFNMRENTENFLNKDTQFQGKHLIAGITNYIGPITDRPRYVTYLDLVNIQTYNGAIS